MKRKEIKHNSFKDFYDFVKPYCPEICKAWEYMENANLNEIKGDKYIDTATGVEYTLIDILFTTPEEHWNDYTQFDYVFEDMSHNPYVVQCINYFVPGYIPTAEERDRYVIMSRRYEKV